MGILIEVEHPLRIQKGGLSSSIREGTPDAGGIWTDIDNSGMDLSDPTNVDFSDFCT